MSNKVESVQSTPLILRAIQSFISNLGIAFPKTMSRLVYRLWFTTTHYSVSKYEKNIAAKAKRLVVHIDRLPVHVWLWGDVGPIVLFSHGWSGRGTQVVSFVEPLVNAGYRVIAFDGPAHGKTPGKQTTIFDFAKVLDGLIEHFAPVDTVMTHSFGAMVFAYLYQDTYSIKRAIFIAPPASIEVLFDNFQNLLAIPKKVMVHFQQKLKQNFGDDLADKVSTLNNVKKFNFPGLIIHDENDPDLPWQDSVKLADAWGQAKFVKTEGLGHIKILRDPKVVRIISEFLCNP